LAWDGAEGKIAANANNLGLDPEGSITLFQGKV
jgi:hypothetical protein